jgi:hypothetical protein
MKLSDNISKLYHQKPICRIVNPWELQETTFFPDFKAKMNESDDYREDRRKWAKDKPTEHVAWCLYRIKDEFAHEYLDVIREDIAVHMRANKYKSFEEAANGFCAEWNGYNRNVGRIMIERIMRKMREDGW